MKNYFADLCRKILQLRKNRWLCIAVVAAVTTETIIPRHLGIILTPSLDHRLFWVNRDPQHVKRGEYVYFVDEELARKVGKPEVPNVFKIIRCDEGDILNVDAAKCFFCNGEYIGMAKDYSRKGEKMPHFEFNGRIPPGFMFVMGEHKDSYDSRYFGLVEKSRVVARLYPIL
ncbi:S26 family signal peptidase [Geobacter sp. DSM 9736]|uniref:S26 family signal peptidase n=1 Tax=Geobacter sp. DSM 9736 TaxID=1277350 RepID=UPI000B50C1BD|nr:S26 family signal peptidase [Geobacter sp. DSM 9736]SNB45436.1 signal peptidase I/conjugal transfer pilin signal peptidase TrbI [Geobacter sp. DSM 9736]